MALLFAAAVCALQAVRVYEGPSTSIEDVRLLWRDALAGELEHDPETAFVEWLLQGHESKKSPLQGESAEATCRGLWLFAAYISLSAAVTTILALTTILIMRGT